MKTSPSNPNHYAAASLHEIADHLERLAENVRLELVLTRRQSAFNAGVRFGYGDSAATLRSTRLDPNKDERSRLSETLADIAYLAGAAGHFSGDSRQDVHQFQVWAAEFEALRTEDGVEERYLGKDYMEAIDEFVAAKLAPAPSRGEIRHRMAGRIDRLEAALRGLLGLHSCDAGDEPTYRVLPAEEVKARLQAARDALA